MKQNKRRVIISSAAAAGLMAAATGAYAAVPAEAKTAMEDSKSDATELGYLALVVIIAIAGLKYMRRAV